MFKKENRGGQRSGAGRPQKPPKQYSEKLKKKILKAVKGKEKDVGQKVEEIFVEMLFDKKVQASVRQAMFKQYFDLYIPQQLKLDVDIPKICLPPVTDPLEDKDVDLETKQ